MWLSLLARAVIGRRESVTGHEASLGETSSMRYPSVRIVVYGLILRCLQGIQLSGCSATTAVCLIMLLAK